MKTQNLLELTCSLVPLPKTIFTVTQSETSAHKHTTTPTKSTLSPGNTVKSLELKSFKLTLNHPGFTRNIYSYCKNGQSYERLVTWISCVLKSPCETLIFVISVRTSCANMIPIPPPDSSQRARHLIRLFGSWRGGAQVASDWTTCRHYSTNFVVLLNMKTNPSHNFFWCCGSWFSATVLRIFLSVQLFMVINHE